MTIKQEVYRMSENAPEEKRGLFDEEGHLRLELLSSGMFTLRFTPENEALVFTWIPDDPEKDVRRTRIPIPKPDPAALTAGGEDYFGCVVGRAATSGLRAFLECFDRI